MRITSIDMIFYSNFFQSNWAIMIMLW